MSRVQNLKKKLHLEFPFHNMNIFVAPRRGLDTESCRDEQGACADKIERDRDECVFKSLRR